MADLIDNLVRMYIESENCINMHALPTNHDIMNLKAAQIVHEMQAKVRTFGKILTDENPRETDFPQEY